MHAGSSSSSSSSSVGSSSCGSCCDGSDGTQVQPAPGRRALVVGAGLSLTIDPEPAAAVAKEPKITTKCAFDIRIGSDNSVPLQRMVIGLFGEEAPILTNNFKQACAAEYPGPANAQARYEQSTAKSISKDRLILFANFPGGDYLQTKVKTGGNKMGSTKDEKIEKKPLAGPETKTSESNDLRLDTVGRVAMSKGGGTFNFIVAPAACPDLDKSYTVIGQVIEGLDLVDTMNNINTTLKGGWINALGGDYMNDVLKLPLQKVKIFKSQVLSPE
mmetsp:Transcript_47594/g.92035  ORF Transcript_47594/g.92035 Transcript_47594/m.92035 type:complete len:273 (+) Transcript_47594:13-831(+)